MQSEAPAVKIIGHWNYPALTAANYRYEEKRFNGTYWEGTGVWHTRDPHHKTVYVVASYPVAAVELLVNGRRVGRCDKPQNTFVFAFPGVDVTQSGWVEAVGYGYDGTPSASDRLETADSPAALRLTLHTAPGGLAADGADIAYVDIAVQDSAGRVCPLCDARIDFTLDGPAQFWAATTAAALRATAMTTASSTKTMSMLSAAPTAYFCARAQRPAPSA